MGRSTVPALLFAAIALSCALVTCERRDRGPIPPLPSSPYELGGTLYGFFPLPREISEESLLAAYEDMGHHGDVVLVQEHIPWEGFVERAVGPSNAFEGIRSAALLAHRQGLEVIFVVDPLNGLNRREFYGLPDGWEASFASPRVRAAFINFTLRVVDELHPHYLGLASEINTYLDAYPDEFVHFLSLYQTVYQAVKEREPKTQIFVTFQWEELNNLWPESAEGRTPYRINWETVEAFEPDLDLWAISSYPYVVFPGATEIPPDYYAPLLSRTAKPLAVAEGGFSSEPVGGLPGTPEEQLGYLRAIDSQLGGSRLVFWIYLLLGDIDLDSYGRLMRRQGVSPGDIETLGLFSFVGLRRGDGEAKPALAFWDSLRARR